MLPPYPTLFTKSPYTVCNERPLPVKNDETEGICAYKECTELPLTRRFAKYIYFWQLINEVEFHFLLYLCPVLCI